VADLRIRVGEQAVKLKQLNADVISAESDLTAMRLEKDELEQALLRDKEEVRGLQRRMKEVEDEKSGFKMVLEKLKKEARQQRGMVSIAKKQLSTAEGGRDSVQQEIREAEKAAEGPESVEEVHPAVAFSPSTLSTAAAVPLPATPKALSPAPTGTSQRSNNPFDRLGKAKAASPPEVTSPSLETTSPSFGTAALLGAGATVGAAAGVVAAGASTLFTAAKDVVVGEHEGSKEAEEPKQAEEPKRTQELQGATTPFGATQAPSAETDPFGAPATSGPTQTMFDNEFDAGFGDSFSSNKAVPAKQTAQFARGTDFDTAFADFDEVPEPAPELVAPGVPKVEEQHPPVEEVHEALPEGIPLGIPKSAIPADLRPEAERSLSTQAIPPSSVAETPLTEEPTSVEPEQPPEDAAPALEPENNASSDEEEGPEDLEAPRGYMSKMKEADDVASPVVAAPPGLSAPVTSETSEPAQKTRRSAPPPPAAKSAAPALNDFDPLGAPITTATATTATAISPTLDADQQPPGAAPPSHAPQTSSFDDDDFDFSDLPPAQVEQPGTNAEPAPLASSAFYDEFAGFDDEFDKPSTGRASDGSNGMSKSYEMVSPNQPSAPFKPEQEETSRHYDEWGFGGHKPVPAPTSGAAMSFDDAFGGDFEPAYVLSLPQDCTDTPRPTQQQQEQYYPPPGPPPAKEAALTPPPIPERRDSAAQPDDLEDVKKVSRTSVSS
jgi:epidermal growth factor receptor substrate 15